jgi:hypothetical protein
MRKEVRKMRTVKIVPVLNGFKVTVGCQEVIFSSIEKLCEELIRYQKDSSGVEREYLENAVNKMQDASPEGVPLRNEGNEVERLDRPADEAVRTTRVEEGPVLVRER